MNPLLEAPPTEEELKAIRSNKGLLEAPPTEEELRAIRGESQKYSPLESAGMAMFNIANFGDEMAGGVQSGLDWITELLGGQSVTAADRKVAEDLKMTPDEARRAGLLTTRDQLYRKAQQEQEAEYNKAREENPWASVGGDVAQGLMTSIIAAPAIGKVAGAAGKLAGADLAATNAANAAGKTFFGTSAGKAGLGALANRALTSTAVENIGASAAFGAAAGAGASHGENIKEIASDALESGWEGAKAGAIYGTALTGAAHGLGTVAKGAANFLKDTPFWRLMHKAYTTSRDTGNKVFGIARNAEIDKEYREYIADLYKRWYTAKNAAGAARDKALEDHADEVIGDVLPQLQKAFELINREGVDESARNQAKEVFESLLYIAEEPKLSKSVKVTNAETGAVKKEIEHLKGDNITEDEISGLVRRVMGEGDLLGGELLGKQATVTRFPKKMKDVFDPHTGLKVGEEVKTPETIVLAIREARDIAKELRDPNMTVSEVNAAVKKIQDLIGRLENKDSTLAKQIREEIAAPLRARLQKQVPDIIEPNQRLAASYELEEKFFPKVETFGSTATKNVNLTPEEQFKQWMDSLSDPERALFSSKVYDFISSANPELNPEMKDALPYVGNLLRTITGEDSSKDLAKMAELASNMKMAQAFQNAKPMAETLKGQTLGTTKGLGVAAASGVGRGVHNFKKNVGNIVDTIATEGAPIGRGAKKVVAGGINIASDWTPQQLKELGGKFLMEANPAAQELGRVLTEASQRDTVGRRALIFALEQNPDYRRMLHGEPNGQ